MKITMQQVEAAYRLASHVFDAKMTAKVAASRLAEEHQLNINSARDFIEQFRQMMHGETFKRTMSSPAMDYFLHTIQKERGDAAAKLAVVSVRKHIEYYEGLDKSKLNKLHSVVEVFSAGMSTHIDLSDQQSKFDAAVSLSLLDTVAARLERLKNANKKPVVVVAASKHYIRNPDVVAQALYRANGKRERCGNAAPFKRKSDGSPYLEVHHRIQLALDGEDSIENAIALCPNCHRKAHYGEYI